MGGMQFDIIMVDVAAPDPAGDPGTLNSIPAQFLSDHFVVEGLQRRLRWVCLFCIPDCWPESVGHQ